MTEEKSKTREKIFVLAILLFVLLLVCLWGIPIVQTWYRFTYVYPPESIDVLLAAKTREDFIKTAHYHGAYFEFKDGSWLAIRAHHTHYSVHYSIATALDSNGVLYFSDNAPCRGFSKFTDLKMTIVSYEDALKEKESKGLEKELANLKQKLKETEGYKVEDSENIKEALSKLGEYNFKVIEND